MRSDKYRIVLKHENERHEGFDLILNSNMKTLYLNLRE